MGLLGQVLAQHQKTTYEQLLVNHIGRPLGLHDTRIMLSEEQQKRLATPYDAGLTPAKNWDVPALAGAGAVRSTCRDMLTFLEANLADDDAPLTRALRLTQEKRHTTENGPSIGLAWHISPDGAVLEHNGMTGGYHAYLALIPDQKIGVVVLSNTATMKITELGGLVRRVASGEEVKPPPRRKMVAVDPETLKSYAGFYAITPQFGLAVTAEDGKLWVEPTGQPKLQVFPESKTKFFFRVVEAEIMFEPDDDGNVDRLILRQSGRELEATRRE
jgi:serine-type D-Ala-D-Ala carboxypeptidase/endopeptidase